MYTVHIDIFGKHSRPFRSHAFKSTYQLKFSRDSFCLSSTKVQLELVLSGVLYHKIILETLVRSKILLRGNRMKKKSNYTDQRQHELSKKKSIVCSVVNSKDFVKSDRIEWLKQLHAEWLGKHNSILNNNKETYLINEPDELDTECY